MRHTKKLIFWTAMILATGLVFAGCSEQTYEQAEPAPLVPGNEVSLESDTMADDVAEKWNAAKREVTDEVQDLHQEVRDFLVLGQDSARHQIHEQAEAIREEAEALRERTRDLKDGMEDKLAKAFESMEQQQDKVKQTWRQLEEAGEDQWQNAAQKLRSAVDELGQQLETVSKQMQSS